MTFLVYHLIRKQELQRIMRAYLWNLAREWLPHGAIPVDDEKLAPELGSPGAHIRTNGQLVLESKRE